MPRLLLGTLCSLSLLLVLGGQSPSRSVGEEPLADEAEATSSDSDFDSFTEADPDAGPFAPPSPAPAPQKKIFSDPTGVERLFRGDEPQGYEEPPRPAATRQREPKIEEPLSPQAPPERDVREPRRAATPTRVQRNFVVTDRDVTSEKRIELRAGDMVVRIVVRGQAAHGAEPESEHATYALEASGKRVTMTTTRNRLSGAVEMNQLDAPADMQPGTTALLEFMQGQAAHLRRSGQLEEAEFLMPLVADLRQLRQHQLNELAEQLARQKAAVSDLESRIAARQGAQPMPTRPSARPALDEYPTYRESDLQPISGTRTANPARLSPPLERYPATEEAEDEVPPSTLELLRNEIRALQEAVRELREEVRQTRAESDFSDDEAPRGEPAEREAPAAPAEDFPADEFSPF